MQGLFITLESTEGAGKGTAVTMLKDCFTLAGRPPVMTREPGGTALAEKIRELLLNPYVTFRDHMTELYLMFASRAEHVDRLVKPSLAAGRTVICERFHDSTYAYQHYARKLPKEPIDALVRILDAPVPNLTFVLDIDPEIGMRRATARGQLDRIEKEHMQFFHDARHGFLTRAAEDTSGRFRIIDASQSIPEVRKQFIDHLLTDGLITESVVTQLKEKYDVA